MLNQDEWELSGELRSPKNGEVYWSTNCQQFLSSVARCDAMFKYPIARRKAEQIEGTIEDFTHSPEPLTDEHRAALYNDGKGREYPPQQWTVGQPPSGEWEVIMTAFGQHCVRVEGGNCQWVNTEGQVCICNVDKVRYYRPVRSPEKPAEAAPEVKVDKPVKSVEWTVEVSEPKKPREKDPNLILAEAREYASSWCNAAAMIEARYKIMDAIGSDIDKANKVLAMLDGKAVEIPIVGHVQVHTAEDLLNPPQPWTEGTPGDGVWVVEAKPSNSRSSSYEVIEVSGCAWRLHSPSGDSRWRNDSLYVKHYQPFTPPAKPEPKPEPPKWREVRWHDKFYHAVPWRQCYHYLWSHEDGELYIAVDDDQLTFLDKEPG